MKSTRIMKNKFITTIIIILILLIAFFVYKKSSMQSISQKTTFTQGEEQLREQYGTTYFIEARELFGEPIREEMIGSQNMGEFHVELYNIYPQKRFEEQGLQLKEATWEFGSNHLVTVWYEFLNSTWQATWKPVHMIVYEKGTEF